MSESAFNRRRNEFPTLVRGNDLLSHSLGPVPRGAADSMQAYYTAWEQHTDEDAWATNWWTLSQRVGDQIARLLGGPPGSVQIQPNASLALSTVISCLNFQNTKRNKIVTTAHDFPSMAYIWEAQTNTGARIEAISSSDGITVPLEAILEAIDETTCLVALSHTSYRTSHRLDAAAIVQHAHRQGALVLFDVYQSAGTVLLDAKGWEVDFLIGGTIKWLCGGPACGYLYVRNDLQRELEPRLTGWVAHDSPFEFAPAPIRYARSVRRFAQGTPSIPALYSALPGLQIIEEVGVERIAQESQRRTEWLVEFALERGWRLNSPRKATERGGSVMIGVDDAPRMVEELARRKIFVDWRPGAGLRISPHFFNTDDEVREALEVLEQLTVE